MIGRKVLEVKRDKSRIANVRQLNPWSVSSQAIKKEIPAGKVDGMSIGNSDKVSAWIENQIGECSKELYFPNRSEFAKILTVRLLLLPYFRGISTVFPAKGREKHRNDVLGLAFSGIYKLLKSVMQSLDTDQ